MHSFEGASGHVHDMTMTDKLLHGEEQVILGDTGYAGANKRPDVQTTAQWFIAMRAGKREPLNKNCP